MKHYMIEIDVEYNNKSEGTVEVEINLDVLDGFDTTTEKIEYIKELTKKESEDIKRVKFDKEKLKDLENEINDTYDTTDFHPNESYEEYMEHENND